VARTRRIVTAACVAACLVTAACTASDGTQILTASAPAVSSPDSTGRSDGRASAPTSQSVEPSPPTTTESSSPPEGSLSVAPLDTTSPPSPLGTAVADLAAKAAPAIGGPPVTGTLTITVGKAGPATSIPRMVKQCLAADADVFGADPSDAIAQPVDVAVTVTSARPANAVVDFNLPGYLQADGSVVAMVGFGLGIWVRDGGADGLECQDPHGSSVESFSTIEAPHAPPGHTSTGKLWLVLWPQKANVNGTDRNFQPQYAILRPTVTLNGVEATITYRPSPSVLWCPDDSGLVGTFAAIVVDPTAAATRGCN